MKFSKNHLKQKKKKKNVSHRRFKFRIIRRKNYRFIKDHRYLHGSLYIYKTPRGRPRSLCSIDIVANELEKKMNHDTIIVLTIARQV